jgi:hypothetical protein
MCIIKSTKLNSVQNIWYNPTWPRQINVITKHRISNTNFCKHFENYLSMVTDLCHSCFRPATPASEKSRSNKLKRRGRGTRFKKFNGECGERKHALRPRGTKFIKKLTKTRLKLSPLLISSRRRVHAASNKRSDFVTSHYAERSDFPYLAYLVSIRYGIRFLKKVEC